MKDQINSKTNCPTCGSEVKIHSEGTTHYYIPVQSEAKEIEPKDIFQFLIDKKYQKEQGEQEYFMYFDVDMPRIINDAIKHFVHPVSSVPLSDKIQHINATPEFLANPENVKAINKMVELAYNYKPPSKDEIIKTLKAKIDSLSSPSPVRETKEFKIEFCRGEHLGGHCEFGLAGNDCKKMCTILPSTELKPIEDSKMDEFIDKGVKACAIKYGEWIAKSFWVCNTEGMMYNSSVFLNERIYLTPTELFHNYLKHGVKEDKKGEETNHKKTNFTI